MFPAEILVSYITRSSNVIMLCRSMALKYYSTLNLSNFMGKGRRIGLKGHGERSFFSLKMQLHLFFWRNENLS